MKPEILSRIVKVEVKSAKQHGERNTVYRLQKIMTDVAQHMQDVSPRFDKGKFLADCGLDTTDLSM